MKQIVFVLVALAACNKSSSNEQAKPASPPTCVDGTSVDCAQAQGKWTGSQCCLDGALTCAPGTNVDCHQAQGKWTGSQCCLAGTLKCVAGTNPDCHQAQGKWTGTQCCMP